MQVKIKIVLFGSILLGIVALTSLGIFSKLRYKNRVKENISTLDSLKYLSINGTQHGIAQSSKFKVIFFFNPDCDHCQAEARLISSNVSSFANADIYFFSVEDLKDIENFAKEFGLINNPVFEVGQVDYKQVIYKMGVNTIPMCFIYSPMGKLLHKYAGEVSIEAIVKYLQ
jgi:thiol-disulfide isomerase/thioredoxin